jgi:uncharacterized hydrophobic protein (TIGR00271 family)
MPWERKPVPDQADPSRRDPEPTALRSHLHGTVMALQHAVASALGIDEERRTETVVTMLENNRRRAPGYWIQLFLATGIATLGLVLGSTAVVIGGMLVSPLMGPILELGMGFAVGSSFLVIRASLRVALSVIAVVAGAALFTLALPFHEITSEIASRTAPTALDLFVAMFCALTAAYTTVRPASDTTSAAAGTAIGIALVPPLCTSGFGLGVGSVTIAGGASLLFTANISAILVLAVLSFLVLGYNQVNAHRVEADVLGSEDTRADRLAEGAHLWLRRVFGSRYGLAMRVLIPLVFLTAVYVPLRRALDEVTWEVRAREAIRKILASEAPRAIQTTLNVERHGITLRLLVVGAPDRSGALERILGTRVEAATGVKPTIFVTAMPDAKTMALAAQSRATAAETEPERVSALRQRVSELLTAIWPSAQVGTLVGWDFVLPAAGKPTVVVRHLGDSLGLAGEALLARELSRGVGVALQVTDAALSPIALVAAAGREQQWYDGARTTLDWVSRTTGTMACVTGPVAAGRRSNAVHRSLLQAIQASPTATSGRVSMRDSTRWTVRASVGECWTADSSRTRGQGKS